jgi:hypothetical protein
MQRGNRVNKYLEAVEEEIALLPVDGRLSRDSVRVWHRFNMYLVNLMDDVGGAIRGYSLKFQGPLVLLVVKAQIDDIPLVAFVTAQTPTDSMAIFLAQLEERRVAWRPDKFA